MFPVSLALGETPRIKVLRIRFHNADNDDCEQSVLFQRVRATDDF